MSLLSTLLLERVQDTIHQFLFQLSVDICNALVGYNLFDGFYDNLAVCLVLVLQLALEFLDNFGSAYLGCYLSGRLDQLLVVFLVEGVSADPEVREEFWNDLLTDVEYFNSRGGHSLLDHLENDLFHFIILAAEFSDQHGREELSKLPRMLAVHKGNDEADRF